MSDHRIHLFDDFTLDLTRGFLLRGDELVHLRRQTYEVLTYLVQNRGRLISKDKLIEDVWRGRAVTDGSLGKCIEELREALGDTSMSYVRNVRGRGYIFDAEASDGSGIQTASEQIDVLRVVVVNEETDGVASSIGGGRIRKHKWGIVFALAALSLLVVGLGYWRFGRKPASPQITSVAVLSFLNESGDPNADYLSDGISESLINSLSQLPQLKVIARSSSFMYKGKEVDPQQVASALGVQGIVMGRIVQRGDNLQISVELVNARDKTQMWGEQYNRKATDLLTVQWEISREISERLRLRLTAGEQTQFARRETANPQAYELLLKGRFSWNKGGTENQKKAIEYYQQAIAADPAYALAYAESSLSYYYLFAASVLDPKEFRPKAEAAARKALELDDSLAEAHLALSLIDLFAWNWAAAERECKRAIELSPNLARAHIIYSFYLTFMGRHEQAIAEAKRAKELDPISPNTNSNVGFQLLLARQNDQAIEAAKKTLELDQNYPAAHALIGYAYAAKGQYPEAIAAYQKAIRLGDDSRDTQIYLGAAYAKAGERAKAQAIVRKLETGKEYVSPGSLADLYVALGERDQAFAVLERAYAAHDAQLQFLGVNPNLDRLRSDPRFPDLLRRVGLAP